MKKFFMTTWILLSSALLMAGGNTRSTLPPVMDIPAQVCKTDRVYVQEDVELMWQDQAYTDTEDGAYNRERSMAKAGNWKHAENYCRRLDYLGYADWRLPTSDELQEVHRIYGQVFAYHRTRDFWSSTPGARGRQFVVYPVDAYRFSHQMRRSNYIRCVRCLHKGDTETGPAPVK